MKQRKIALSMVGLLAFSNAFAGGTEVTSTPVQPEEGFLQRFYIGGSADRWQPTSTDNDLAYANIDLDIVTGANRDTSTQIRWLKPNYSWGWNAFVGYIFPNQGPDMELHYVTLHNGQDDEIPMYGSDLSGVMAGIVPFNLISSTLGIFDSASARVQYDFNQLELAIGQPVNMNARISIHPVVGIRWATINRELSTVFSDQSAPDTDILTTYANSRFSGVGPFLGIDGNYDVWHGFSVAMHGKATLLLGNLHSKLYIQEVEDSSGVISVLAQNVPSEEVRRAVPALDGRLGLGYTYLCPNGGGVTLEAGWSIAHYFNSIDNLTSDFSSSNTLNSIKLDETTDFDMQGPYINAMLMF